MCSQQPDDSPPREIRPARPDNTRFYRGTVGAFSLFLCVAVLIRAAQMGWALPPLLLGILLGVAGVLLVGTVRQ